MKTHFLPGNPIYFFYFINDFNLAIIISDLFFGFLLFVISFTINFKKKKKTQSCHSLIFTFVFVNVLICGCFIYI